MTRTDPRRDNPSSQDCGPRRLQSTATVVTAWSKCDCVCVTNRNDWTGADESLFALLIVSLQRCCACVTYSAGVFPSLPTAQSSSCSLTGLPFLTAVIRSFTRLLSCYAQCSAASQCSKSVIDSLWIPIPRFAQKNSQPVVHTYQRTSGSKVD